jgi:hypothetical protein
MDVAGASIAVPFAPNTLSTTADTPGTPAQPLHTVTPATGVPVVPQDFNSPLAENTSTPPSVRPIVDSIVADKNIVPSKLTTSAAVAQVCHNDFNYSWSQSTKSPPITTKAGRPSRKKKEVAANAPWPAKLPNTWHVAPP